MKFNTKIQTILPIALAIMLPTLRIYGIHAVDRGDVPVIAVWLFSSLVLYLLWYCLWLLWDFNQGRKKWYAFGLFCIIATLIALNIRLMAEGVGIAIFRVLIPTILFLAIQYALKSQQKIARLRLEKEQLQSENYKSQLKTLRTQIDPHFLFNSLNTLRAMIRQQHSGAEQFVLSLSDFYRQTLQHNTTNTISLSNELEVLKSYLFLMKNRNEQALHINLKIEETLLERQIPTMALQIVVENCFKHNSMTSKKPLQIDITSTEDFIIRVCNNIQAKIADDESTWYGLGTP